MNTTGSLREGSAYVPLPFDRRYLAAVGFSLAAHVTALAVLHTYAFTPPALPALDTLQIQLVAVVTPETPKEMTQVEQSKPAPRPTRVARPKPVPRPVAKPRSVARTETPIPKESEPVAQPEPAPVRTAAAAPRAPNETAKAVQVLVEARSDAASLNNPKPPYPLVARRRRLEGEVLLSVEVLRDGLPGDVRVKRSSGHELLDEAALSTVRRWHFVPARRGTTPVDSTVEVPIRFRLEG